MTFCREAGSIGEMAEMAEMVEMVEMVGMLSENVVRGLKGSWSHPRPTAFRSSRSPHAHHAPLAVGALFLPPWHSQVFLWEMLSSACSRQFGG